MEKATRLRQATCPWQALRDPFTIEVLRAHRWWKERQLEAMYAGAVPEAVRRGVDVYESALNAVLAHDRELEAKRREAERDNPPPSSDPPTRWPMRRRR